MFLGTLYVKLMYEYIFKQQTDRASSIPLLILIQNI